MARKKKYWTDKLKEGTYRNQLERLGLIKEHQKIPVTLSEKICHAPIGKTIIYKGKSIKVTELLKKRACAHVNLYHMAEKRKKKRR